MVEEDKQPVPDWVTTPPEFTIVSDGAITVAEDDNFDLGYRVGPLFDILRHRDTKTPFAAAIYGD